MMDIKVMLIYGLLQLLHRHLREMFVKYLTGLCFDNGIGLRVN